MAKEPGRKKGRMNMFDKFGEFDSVVELNMAAEGLKKEGDIASLKELAKENGLDEDDVEDYVASYGEGFATVMMAAVGRLEVQEREIEAMESLVEKMPLRVILSMTKGLCTNKTFAREVMKKGKRVKEIYSIMRKVAEGHKKGNMGISCGTDRELEEIIKTYYGATKEDTKKELEKLYK